MAASPPRCYSLPRPLLLRLSSPILESLSQTPYSPPEGSAVSVKSLLEGLLRHLDQVPEDEFRLEIRDFILCCAAMAASEGVESPAVYWVPAELANAARSALREMAVAVGLNSEREMVAEMIPEVVVQLKGVIKESCVDPESVEVVAASAKAPVAYAVLAAHQFRWLVSQILFPNLGKLIWLVIPCALTALDHWSPEVKEQGMLTFMHVGKNVTMAELGWYEDAILDACCRNIASSDELWHCVVEVSVLMLTCLEGKNPRSSWFEQIMNEMLGHLERQPMNKDRRVAWLRLIQPVFNAMGLVLLAHFRRIFSLFFHWMHADDDKTILLVLERLNDIIKLTWIRKSPYFQRLVDELILLYKESATKKGREIIRNQIMQTLILLQKCQGLCFESAWNKHNDDPDLTMLTSSFSNLVCSGPESCT
ncbi:Armadillo-like helical-containing protein [Dioscorea alata]|uniref:Armadillo-like helical-containing protein n=1 Tax=Dioscorea alata TaxID=55571 RepID=A0ACB7WJM4_DIOAL|nr:Armadillo-like helical-containing protein [Dioscorea alata]